METGRKYSLSRPLPGRAANDPNRDREGADIVMNTAIPIDSLLSAAQREDVREAMRAFYDEADRRIAALPHTCWNKGECCQFGQFGHRLYVTTLEAAYFMATAPDPGRPFPVITEDTCPCAHDGQCNARDRRPLACRIFYCDPAARDWQGPLTEELLTQLRKMHGALDVPYVYADWMQVLRTIDAR